MAGLGRGLQWSWPLKLIYTLVFASSMAIVNGESRIGGDVIQISAQGVTNPPVRRVIAGRYDAISILNTGTVLSLCVMFIVGVRMGFSWKGFHKVAKTVPPSPSASPPSPPSPPSPLSSPPSPDLPTRKMPRAISVGSLKQYRLKEIVDMTDDFKLELGRGGQGVVYFASPSEGRGKAAVKRLQKNLVLSNANEGNHHSQDVIEKAFWAELKTISRLHHRNLVSLLGYCVEDDDLFLVYEFMGKGSLSQRLHSKDAAGLDWNARLRCAVEVAQGLEYLHSHASPSLVHRDIKSGNILFDDEMNAKIADFGLSKAVEMDQEATVTTRLRGTYGYVDPAYLQTGIPCEKNDVYSYGVVLLELITGRRAIEKKTSVVHWCRDFLGTDEQMMRNQLPRLVDSRMSLLDEPLSYDQIFEVVKVALSCVQERQESRPSMKDVVAGLYNANCKDSSTSTEFPTTEASVVPLYRFGSNVRSSHDGSVHSPSTHAVHGDCSPSYDVKDNSILVKCTIAGAKVVLRCKIWPTPRTFGLNKVEASLNGAFLWKKGLWWFNAKSSRDFTVGDDVKLVAEWHVTLRTSWDTLAPHDPRRNLGPFCVEYLALKDENHVALVEYLGDKSPLLEKSPSQERNIPRRQSSGSGSGSAERRSTHAGRLRRSDSPI